MDKKEGMNRWKMARTFRPLLLWGGLAAALLWGCFNPIMSAPDPGSENQGSADQGSENSGSENPGDGPSPNGGAAGEFTVTLRVGDGGPETGSRNVVGPSADDIRYKGVWNTVQVIAVDAETHEVKDNQQAELEKENDSGKTIWVDVAQGKRYHVLVLMGHRERNYTNENPDIKYEYKSDPPTLLAAGFLGDQAIHGQATLSVTMKPLVVDTVFTYGSSVIQAALPNPKTQLPDKVAASVVWTVSGGFDTLVDAQTRTGLPGGINWGGLTLAEQKTIVRFKDDLTDTEALAVLGGADRNQIVLGLGAHDKDTYGSANFRLTYNPLGEKETWIIRNGVNDEAQDVKTTFTLKDGKIPWDGDTANGNGAVVFSFEDRTITNSDLTNSLPAPVLWAKPVTKIDEGRYTGTVVWTDLAMEKEPPVYFEQETLYVATVTDLTAKEGFQFSTDGVTVTHSGSSHILYVPDGSGKVVVIFPTAAWEWGGYFSGSSEAEMDSAIDAIVAAQQAGFSSLSLKLLPWPETVNLDASAKTDIKGGLTLIHEGTVSDTSPAVVIIDGGGKTIPLTGTSQGSVITVRSGVTLTLRNITFAGSAANTAALIKVDGGKLILENGAVITGNTNNGGVGGGVYVNNTASFTKESAVGGHTSGTIYGADGGKLANTATSNSGHAVYVAGNGWKRDNTVKEDESLDSGKNKDQGGGWD